MRIPMVVVLGAMAACGTDGADTVLDGQMLPDGYIRYEAAPVTLQPGETKQFVQWVSGPIDRDVDLVDVRGSQGPGGHHAVLFASPDVEPIGTTRDWTGADQVTARFLGGVGGEGISGGDTPLPPGTVFRIPAGSGFYIQTHYLNASDEPMTSGSTLEIKIADPSPDVTVLSMFVSSTVDIKVGPGTSEQVLTCDIQDDTALIMYVNHIHETGTSVSTVMHPKDGGGEQMLKQDSKWNYEWTTHPNFITTALDQPLMLHKGDQIVTTCNWNNQSGRTLGFPDEMCAFLTFYVGTKDRACVNGKWLDL